MRIICLEAENVKRLKAIRMNPDRTLVRIEGRNAQGKSSVLDAIAAALGGGKMQPDMPVRQGEKRASVRLDLGEFIVWRKWNASGHTVLEVTTADGVPQKSPQAILDKIIGDLTFDPWAFVRMKPKEQAEVLKRLAGLDFTKLDAEREQLYVQRTYVNREVKSAEAVIGIPPPTVADETLIDISELVANQQQYLIPANKMIKNM